ncbi:LOW QUALITY PROTEIN: hypothetical protein TorRG33x02_321020 [Trema orientale]|uniref:Transmembrane protein n=1 Tax=Trema orientale TaxID=63057 RepID=A0A2P5BHA2_TREOI|nr:LOW QUALITY PROTEIN: hypothetical protein TorRG33x02_321020 [Trema orientale]
MADSISWLCIIPDLCLVLTSLSLSLSSLFPFLFQLLFLIQVSQKL